MPHGRNTMVTPLPWGSRPVGNPVFRHDETYERHVGASHITFSGEPKS
jgi:hypothetical protein